jgi:hypothetical protein
MATEAVIGIASTPISTAFDRGEHTPAHVLVEHSVL